MTLSKKRRNEIAWHYLADIISKRSVENVRVENLHKEICSYLAPKHPMRANELCWQFCSDLSDRVFMEASKDSEETRYELSQEERHQFAYDILLQIIANEGFRLNTNTKREIGNIAEKLSVEVSEMRNFMRDFLRRLVCTVLH